LYASARKLLQDLADSFWVLPAGLVVGGTALGGGLAEMERAGRVPDALVSGWVYSGGEEGARTLLGALAGSSIGVAGTIFSITIAALTLASQQMGPRLLRNFTRDRGAQWTLGVLLGAFAYALMVLRTVRGGDGDDGFVPHVSVTVGVALAMWCLAMLVYFVHHVATRINVDTVIGLVHGEFVDCLRAQTQEEADTSIRQEPVWRGGLPIAALSAGYVQHLDLEGLAEWACEKDARVRLLVRAGDYVFTGAPIALAYGAGQDEASEVVRGAMALGGARSSPADLTYPARQLAEVAVRALSPGINDPMTAISVLDRMGDVLCRLAVRRLRSGLISRKGRVVVICPPLTYDDLVGAMLDLIRQSAERCPAVMVHMLCVIAAAAGLETAPDRRAVLRRHAEAVTEAARRGVSTERDKDALTRAVREARRALSGKGAPERIDAPA
jgi:uncharacterized membrane protein